MTVSKLFKSSFKVDWVTFGLSCNGVAVLKSCLLRNVIPVDQKRVQYLLNQGFSLFAGLNSINLCTHSSIPLRPRREKEKKKIGGEYV